MSTLTLLTPPAGTDETFRQRLKPHPDDVDGEQPYDAREAKVLREAIAWSLVPDYDPASWYTLSEALREPAPRDGIEPALWVPFRTWAGWIKGQPVDVLASLPEFNPSIYAPSGEPYPEGTVFTAEGLAYDPHGGEPPLGDLVIPAAMAEATVSAEDAGLTIRELVARIRGAG